MFTVLLCPVSLDSSQCPHHLCLVVYRFPPSFVPKISSHGNLKEKRPFYPTWPSTRDLSKSHCINEGPKETIEHVSSQVGGVAQALGPGQLPRSEKQVTNMRRSEKFKGRNEGDAAADDLFEVMQNPHRRSLSSVYMWYKGSSRSSYFLSLWFSVKWHGPFLYVLDSWILYFDNRSNFLAWRVWCYSDHVSPLAPGI